MVPQNQIRQTQKQQVNFQLNLLNMKAKPLWTTMCCIWFLSMACGESKQQPDKMEYQALPLQSSIDSVAPMTGIVLWTNNPLNYTQAISLEFSYMLYKDVVKAKGVYDWSSVDRLLEAVASRGHHAILRFRYVYVGDKESAVPQYIRDLPDYEETIAISEGRETCFPDWRHPELQRFHLEFHKKLAERYNHDKRIAFLQTGFGLWAEYHIYQGSFILGRTFPSKDFQARFFRVMNENFTELPWSISKDAANEQYSPFSAQAELKKLKFGIFDDSFMHEKHDEYNTDCWNFFDRNRYKHSPAGGEFGYYRDYDQRHVLDPEGIYGRNFESEAKKFHITYMIGNDQPRYQSLERIKEASMACGYKFSITRFAASSDSVLVEIKNTGVAPIYRDAYVTVDGIRSSKSLRKLQPNSRMRLAFKRKTAKPQLSIESDFLLEGQKIKFAADLKQ